MCIFTMENNPIAALASSVDFRPQDLWECYDGNTFDIKKILEMWERDEDEETRTGELLELLHSMENAVEEEEERVTQPRTRERGPLIWWKDPVDGEIKEVKPRDTVWYKFYCMDRNPERNRSFDKNFTSFSHEVRGLLGARRLDEGI